jgi:hypothetical protein
MKLTFISGVLSSILSVVFFLINVYSNPSNYLLNTLSGIFTFLLLVLILFLVTAIDEPEGFEPELFIAGYLILGIITLIIQPANILHILVFSTGVLAWVEGSKF